MPILENVEAKMLEDLASADPTEFASSEVWNAMEKVLERLDATYALEHSSGEAFEPEDMHKRRVQIMCGIVKNALNLGRERGLQEAEKEFSDLIRGNKKTLKMY
jgi:hypothetical protein